MLKIKDLAVDYGHVKALKGLNFEVREGQILTLIGANGAGKSSFLKAISGLLVPSQGSIEFQGKSILKVPAEKLVFEGIVHVPEGRRIFSGMSVQENLMLGAYGRKDKAAVHKEIEEIFAQFPILETRKHQDAHTLSGGEQQMLAISRALLSQPKLLLLDEPSMGLAPLMVKEIFKIIKAINAKGVSIILVEQNASAALELADYAYLLENGSIKLQGNAKEMKESEMIREIYLGHGA
ncbi:MAG: ABC transporter ATP-binding protein [Erysipelothrix sp.]|nr:ABC transporter ATP-binding protein [Erysipelothrix sp.]